MLNGPDIHEAMLSVRRFHQQVALLLRTADGHMLGERGFKPLCGASALAYGSASIHHPDQWMPNLAFRFYTRERSPEIVTFVSAILCPRGADSHVRRYTEPLVSAGWVRFAAAPASWNGYWWAGMITWTDVPRDGTLSHWRAEEGSPDKNGSLEQRCLGVPLVEITTTEGLVSRVLEPVVESLASV